MRNRIIKFLVLAFILSLFLFVGCNDEKTSLTKFDVPDNVEVNYGAIYSVPIYVGRDNNDKTFFSEYSVVDSKGNDIVVSNNELFIEDINGYTVNYYIVTEDFSETKTMKLNVVDKQAPVIFFDGIKDTKVYTKESTKFEIPVENVKASDNLSNVTISYKVFKDNQEIIAYNDEIDVSNIGEYEIVFYATDANGNVSEKTLNVYSTECDENIYLDFESKIDTSSLYGNNVVTNYLSVERVKYDDLSIARLDNGGDYAIVLKPIINAVYPRYILDFGKALPAGTKISYKLYFDAHETAKKVFTVEGAENCIITTTNYSHNEWISIDFVLTNNASYVTQFLHLAVIDGKDTPAYNYLAGIKFYIDNVVVTEVDSSYYENIAMIYEHIYNTSLEGKPYLEVVNEDIDIGGYKGAGIKMEVPVSNMIQFDADAVSFINVYAKINGYTKITTHIYATAGKIALNTWSSLDLPVAGAWYNQTTDISKLNNYFLVMRDNPATVYMYFEFS